MELDGMPWDGMEWGWGWDGIGMGQQKTSIYKSNQNHNHNHNHNNSNHNSNNMMGVNPHPVNLAQALLLEEQARASEEINAYRPLPEFRDALTALEGRALQRARALASLVPMQLYVAKAFLCDFPCLPFPLSLPFPLAQHLCRLPSRIPSRLPSRIPSLPCVKNCVKNLKIFFENFL